jgi:di/tricarboxylate transporter
MSVAVSGLVLLFFAFLLVTAFEILSMEVAAVGLLTLLVVFDLIHLEHAYEGFANPAVITIAALYVLNAAIQKSGLVASIAGGLSRVAVRRPHGAFAIVLAAAGFVSMFISNVATTVLLVPAVMRISRRAKISASRYLMPLAYMSLAGGMATLIGATNNLVVHGSLIQMHHASFGFFEYAYVGIPIAALALIYLVGIGWWLVPERRSGDAMDSLRGYLLELQIPEGSKLHGLTVAQANLSERFGVTLLAIHRSKSRVVSPGPEATLAVGDRLIVEAGSEEVALVSASKDLNTVHDSKVQEHDLESDGIQVYEALVPPRSDWEGKTARSMQLRSASGITVLAVLRRASAIRKRPQDVKIKIGDELLLQGPKRSVEEHAARGDIFPLNQGESASLNVRRVGPPLAVLAAVILSAAMGWLPVSVAALLGAFIVVVLRIVPAEEALESIDLKVLIVVACILPFGHAIENAGLAEILKGALHHLGDRWGAWSVLAALFVSTSILTQFVQKAAIAICLPLAFIAAKATGGSAAPYLMAVAIAASCGFLTPLAHPVNLIVSGPGAYKFSDYARVGLGLQLLATVAALILIPLFWPI